MYIYTYTYIYIYTYIYVGQIRNGVKCYEFNIARHDASISEKQMKSTTATSSTHEPKNDDDEDGVAAEGKRKAIADIPKANSIMDITVPDQGEIIKYIEQAGQDALKEIYKAAKRKLKAAWDAN